MMPPPGAPAEELRLANVPNVTLVHEALADQIEVNQILAHRDAQSMSDPDSDH